MSLIWPELSATWDSIRYECNLCPGLHAPTILEVLIRSKYHRRVDFGWTVHGSISTAAFPRQQPHSSVMEPGRGRYLLGPDADRRASSTSHNQIKSPWARLEHTFNLGRSKLLVQRQREQRKCSPSAHQVKADSISVSIAATQAKSSYRQWIALCPIEQIIRPAVTKQVGPSYIIIPLQSSVSPTLPHPGSLVSTHFRRARPHPDQDLAL